MKTIGAIVGLVVVALYIGAASLIEGFCLSILWRWFLVPLGVTAISIPIAIGLSLVAAMLTHQHVHKPKETADGDSKTLILRPILGPFMVLGIGYIVKLFI